MSKLPLVEDFYTLQGEGFHAGQAVWFIRLGGCDAGCAWCDAKFTWDAGRFHLVEAEEIAARTSAARAVVVTGGEPLRYPLGPLTDELHARGKEVYLETAGTYPLSGSFDWICLSPKRRRPPLDEIWARADELKVIVAELDDLAWAEQCAARVATDCLLYLQPEWGRMNDITPAIVEYIKANPRWRISLQIHKFMDIP
ncbi:MAG: 7-carboxy-7-deazaguanine synthase QueE [Rikenellaceae bacterium]|jgi:organic radical activating enzyme|nr:7-carboxy-7-deazaguanine synthase QueE [Rikenellaceae bacterium]